MKVEAFKHKNVMGEESLYIRISNEGFEPALIRVGKDNYDKVANMTGALISGQVDIPNQTKLPLKEKQNEGGKQAKVG